MKKKKADLQISLFPFLSILACVIGILTLMITAIVIAQIDPEAVNEKIETALEEDDEFQNKIAEKKKEIQKLKEELKDIKENPRQKIDPKLKDRLKKEILALAKEAQKRQIENKQSKIILGEVVKVKSDLSKLMKNLEVAEDEWELMKEPEKFATMVIKQAGSGNGGDLEPTFIECHERGIKVYDKNGKSFEVLTDQISKNTKLKSVIQQVAKEGPYRIWRSSQGTEMDARFVKRDGSKITLKDKQGIEIKLTALQLAPSSRRAIYKYDEARKLKLPDPEARYIIFLLRSKGFSSWYRTTLICEAIRCKFGQIPLDGDGEIDLSLFLGS